jgi:hypothetical protein
MVLRAWGDESKSSYAHDPNTYIFGAVITDGAEAESTARDRLQSLLLPGQKKIHWRYESDKRRDQIISALGECGLDGFVVTRIGTDDERDERRRRKCFEYFAVQLIQHDVWELTLESRGKTGDALDMAMVKALGAAGTIPTKFRLGHSAGSTNPLLWAADAVCGAVVSSRIGEVRWLRRLERIVQFEMQSRPAY